MEWMMLFKAFAAGGVICVIGQLLIAYTKLTPARILVSYVVIGVIVSGIGWYEPLVEMFGAGVTVPLTGFGHLLASGVKETIGNDGFIGILTGGLTAASGGIAASVFFGYIVSLFTKPKMRD